MGVIQQSINQMIGTTAILSKLDPNSEKRANLREIKKSQDTLKKQQDIAKAAAEKDINNKDIQKYRIELGETAVSLAKRKSELNPSEENYQSFIDAAKSLSELKTSNLPVRNRYKENLRSDTIQEAKSSQKANFKSYPADLERTIAILKGDLNYGNK